MTLRRPERGAEAAAAAAQGRRKRRKESADATATWERRQPYAAGESGGGRSLTVDLTFSLDRLDHKHRRLIRLIVSERDHPQVVVLERG